MRPDQERVRNLLTDTVTLLCKNGLQYQTELRVQGVLGITLDNNDVFIVHINEKFGGDIGGAISIRNDEGDAAKTLLGGKQLDTRGDTLQGVNSKASHKRRRRSRESSASPTLPANGSQQHVLHRPIKIFMPSTKEASLSGVVRNRSSLQNSSILDPALPSSEDIPVVKVKTEEEDVLIIEETEDSKAEILGSSQNIPHTTDQSAMLDSYPNLSLSEIQGSYQPFGEVPGVSNNSTNSGVDGTAPPPIKRRATSGSTQDSYSGSSEMGPTPDRPFITGIMRNETLSGDVAPQNTTATSWDPSHVPDFGSLSARDSQMILDSIPGCSTWDTSQQSTMRTPTSHSTLQNTSDQSSESAIKLKSKRAAEKMRRYRAHRANTDPTFRLKEAEKKRSQRKRDKGTISCEKLEEMRRLNRIRQIRFREKRRSDRASAGSSVEHKPEMKTRAEHDKQRPRRVCKVKQETV